MRKRNKVWMFLIKRRMADGTPCGAEVFRKSLRSYFQKQGIAFGLLELVQARSATEALEKFKALRWVNEVREFRGLEK